MTAASQFSTKWRKLLKLSTSYTSISRDHHGKDANAGEDSDTSSQTIKGQVDNASSSPLLRLPPELRNQIYSYLDLSKCTIEVISLAKTQFYALDENDIPFRHNPYPNEQIWYRLEEAADEEFSLDKLNIDTRRKRCVSVPGLFALPRVCRQLRAETLLLHFEHPSFAFSDKRFNYARAFPAFLHCLSSREKTVVRSICWPLRQAREFYISNQARKPIELPDRAFVQEFCTLPNLERVALRYVATDIGAARLNDTDLAEFRHLVKDVDDGEQWRVEQIFRRKLEMRGMRKQLSGRDDVVIECVRTKRVVF